MRIQSSALFVRAIGDPGDDSVKRIILGALAFLLPASLGFGALCDLQPTCTSAAPCDFNNQANWFNCSVGGPQAGDTSIIRAGRYASGAGRCW